MNRIYQGRVTKVEIPDGKNESGKPRWKELPKTEWEHALWNHHQLFQDAVNYYIVALAALADPEHATSRLIKDLRSRVNAAWSEFPRSVGGDARSLRQSIAHWLQLSDEASLEDASEAVLNGNEATPQVRALSLALLLNQCGGESAIQQAAVGICLAFVMRKPNRLMTSVLFPKRRRSEKIGSLSFSMESPVKVDS